jgi:hypothetical protein
VYLAGGVAQDGEASVLGGHAGAVVPDQDAGGSAVPELYLDPGCPGVQGILDQLLDHGGRAVDHFARGDLLGDPGI